MSWPEAMVRLAFPLLLALCLMIACTPVFECRPPPPTAAQGVRP